jgi:hypothetical protein
VQLTAIDVVPVRVAVVHVPSEVAVTTTPDWNPVPVIVKALVALAIAVAGETAVMVGPAPMTSGYWIADTL